MSAAADPPPSSAQPLRIDAETRLKFLMDEYKEATAYCRSQDLLTRTNNLVFVAFFAALAGLVERSSAGTEMLVFCVLGVFGSMLFAYVGIRSRSYYLVYLARAHEIEEILGLDLLRRSNRQIKTRRIPLLGIRFDNSTAFLTIQIVALIYFIVRLIIALSRWHVQTSTSGVIGG
jgi:hypothetical protein